MRIYTSRDISRMDRRNTRNTGIAWTSGAITAGIGLYLLGTSLSWMLRF